MICFEQDYWRMSSLRSVLMGALQSEQQPRLLSGFVNFDAVDSLQGETRPESNLDD